MATLLRKSCPKTTTMHIGKNFSLKETLLWTRREIFKFILLSTIPTVLYQVFDFKFLALPWLPVALIGTAVAFLIGFKNNASYDRLWEARKIWGAIVNSSRTWGIMVKDFVTDQFTNELMTPSELNNIHQRLIYRHVAWLTALRFQLRKAKKWESMDKAYNKEDQKRYHVPELEAKMDQEMKPFLSKDDQTYLIPKKNKATHLLALQSKDLKRLYSQKIIEDFRHMEMVGMLQDLFTQQGKCERIKNFPYPRQFATLSLFFIWIFVALVPFGMLEEFEKLGENFVWLTIPFSVLVSWIFHTMEKIGEATENPFEGGANDIPMAALSRTIEIDLRQMLEETELPEPVQAVNDILM